MKAARIVSKCRPGSILLELREGRDGRGGKIYSAGVASASEDARPKLIERLMEVAREREIERLFLASVDSAADNLDGDSEYWFCPGCGKYWPVKEPDGSTEQIFDACRLSSRGMGRR